MLPVGHDHRVELHVFHRLQHDLLNGESRQPAVGVVHRHRVAIVLTAASAAACVAAGVGPRVGQRLRVARRDP